MRRQQPLWLSLGPSSSQVFFLHRHLPSAPLWISEWLQGSLQILRGGTSAIWPGFGSENFSHMAGVWIRELQPYGRGLDQRTSAIWPGFGWNWIDIWRYYVVKFWNSKGVPKLTPFWCFARRGKPPSRRRPRRRAVAVLAAGPSPYSPPSRRRPRRQEPHGIHAQNLPEGTLDQRSLCLLAWFTYDAIM